MLALLQSFVQQDLLKGPGLWIGETPMVQEIVHLDSGLQCAIVVVDVVC